MGRARKSGEGKEKMNILFWILFTFVNLMTTPLSCIVYLFTWKWYGEDVYGALYQRSETGKWK